MALGDRSGAKRDDDRFPAVPAASGDGIRPRAVGKLLVEVADDAARDVTAARPRRQQPAEQRRRALLPSFFSSLSSHPAIVTRSIDVCSTSFTGVPG